MTPIACDALAHMPTRSTIGSRKDWLVASGLLVAALAAMVFVAVAPLRSLLFRTTDDAFYYFQVARNIVGGVGPTFDGIHPTNGFHPLWMLILLPVIAAAGGDGEVTLRFVYGVVTLLAAGTLWL